MILNYIFIGFVCTFIIDYICYKFKDHKSFKNVPEWSWTARISFALLWPLGILFTIYQLFNTRKQ